MVIEGTTVVPFMVLIQVFRQLKDWLLQPLRQVADDAPVVTDGAGVTVPGTVLC
jgi:hypothetical protein